MLNVLLTGCILASGIHDPSLGLGNPIAEEDIDASSLDAKSPPKKASPSPLDDIEFVSEAEKQKIKE